MRVVTWENDIKRCCESKLDVTVGAKTSTVCRLRPTKGKRGFMFCREVGCPILHDTLYGHTQRPRKPAQHSDYTYHGDYKQWTL